ncbi:MAG TPA: hypothetical protein VJ917_10470 [Saprospiraceae bacterium]|nr:hypothetical protein [Saprospiraceae bacterium]
MEDSSAIILVVSLLVLIYAIVSLLLPFFVLRIRNEMISMNKKMSKLIDLLTDTRKASDTTVHNSWQEARSQKPKQTRPQQVVGGGRRVKICPHCGEKNDQQDEICVFCSKPL